MGTSETVALIFHQTESGDDLNRWTQHLFSNDRDGDVVDETKTKNLLFAGAEIVDVGALAKR